MGRAPGHWRIQHTTQTSRQPTEHQRKLYNSSSCGDFESHISRALLYTTVQQTIKTPYRTAQTNTTFDCFHRKEIHRTPGHCVHWPHPFHCHHWPWMQRDGPGTPGCPLWARQTRTWSRHRWTPGRSVLSPPATWRPCSQWASVRWGLLGTTGDPDPRWWDANESDKR